MSLAPLALKSAAFMDEMHKVKSETEKHLPALFHYLDRFIGHAVKGGKDELFRNQVGFRELLHSHGIRDIVDLSKDNKDLQKTFEAAADKDYQASEENIRNPLNLAQHLDSVIDLQTSITSRSQPLSRSKLFISPVLVRVKNIASKFFNAAESWALKKLPEISKAISNQERANETAKLFDRLNSAKPKILIFDIDGTLRPSEAGSAGHITPNLDDKLISDLQKLKKDTRYQIYFVTTRPESEIRKSNVLRAGIPVFCQNGRVKINIQGQTEKTVQDLDPELSTATEGMKKSIKQYIKVNYPASNVQESSTQRPESPITDIFTLSGSVCFGIKANDYTGLKQSLIEDLNNFTSANHDWEVKEYGRFIELRHRKFNADKFRPLAQILMENHANGTANREDIYI
jgi:hydroxymethylpyrimidine pyrophosphatase-like HAD family hydrolase